MRLLFAALLASSALQSDMPSRHIRITPDTDAYVLHVPEMRANCLIVVGPFGAYGIRDVAVACQPVTSK